MRRSRRALVPSAGEPRASSPGQLPSTGAAGSPAFMAVGRFTAMGLGLLGTPFIARALGPEGRGLTAAILAVVVMVPVVVGFGVPLASRRRAATGAAPDATRIGRRWALLTVLPVALIAWSLEQTVFTELGDAERVAFYVSLASVPLTVSWLVDANVLMATRQYRRVGLIAIVQAAVSTGAVLVLWTVGRLDVATVLYANAGGHAVTFLLGRIWVSGQGGTTRQLWAQVREGGTVAGGEVADVTARKADQMLALPIIGAHGAGIYSVAVTAGTIALPMVQALGNAAFAGLTTADRLTTALAVRHGVALSLMCACLTAVAAWFGIPLVFGQDFAEARVPSLVLVAGSVVVGALFMMTMALIAQKRGTAMTMAQIAGLVVSVGLLYPLGQAAGPTGLAAAMVSGSCVTALVALRALQLTPWSALPRPADFPAAIRHLLGRISP